MITMRFDFRDIFRSARLAFSFQRIWIQFVGLIAGYASYVLLTYVSLILSGKSFNYIWNEFRLIPCVVGIHLPWYGWVVYGIGIAILLFFWLISSMGVARATYMYLKGNTFYTWKEAMAFALKKKAGSVISTPIAIFCIAFFIGLGGVVVGLLGRIPYVGELGISIFSTVWFAASLFLVFVTLALGVSLLLTPAILATTDDDAFEGIFQSFSTLYGQPWRLIIYEVLVVLISIFGFGALSFFAKRAWNLMTTILIWGMGDKYAELSYAASALFQNLIYPAVNWSRSLLGEYSAYFFFTRDFIQLDLPIIMTISSWIFGLFLLLIGGFIVSYPLAIFNAGQCQIFLILKKKKDDENLLERKDKEEEEEEVEEEKEEKPEEKKPKKEEKKKSNKKKENKTK